MVTGDESRSRLPDQEVAELGFEPKASGLSASSSDMVALLLKRGTSLSSSV